MSASISLPMYDFPELAWANDALVAAIAAALPKGLADPVRRRSDDLPALWRAPDLLLTQTCGYPLMTAFADAFAYVATPCYDLPGCAGGRYDSVVVVRADDAAECLADLRGRRAAINGRDSQSGHNCLRRAVAPLAHGRPFFSDVIESGAHAASLAAVASGRADVATLDCVSHALWARDVPERLAGTRVLGRTAVAPALPYVTRAGIEPEILAALQAALAAVAEDPDLAAARQALALSGFTQLGLDAYDEILEMERAAVELGYPDLI